MKDRQLSAGKSPGHNFRFPNKPRPAPCDVPATAIALSQSTAAATSPLLVLSGCLASSYFFPPVISYLRTAHASQEIPVPVQGTFDTHALHPLDIVPSTIRLITLSRLRFRVRDLGQISAIRAPLALVLDIVEVCRPHMTAMALPCEPATRVDVLVRQARAATFMSNPSRILNRQALPLNAAARTPTAVLSHR